MTSRESTVKHATPDELTEVFREMCTGIAEQAALNTRFREALMLIAGGELDRQTAVEVAHVAVYGVGSERAVSEP